MLESSSSSSSSSSWEMIKRRDVTFSSKRHNRMKFRLEICRTSNSCGFEVFSSGNIASEMGHAHSKFERLPRTSKKMYKSVIKAAAGAASTSRKAGNLSKRKGKSRRHSIIEDNKIVKPVPKPVPERNFWVP